MSEHTNTTSATQIQEQSTIEVLHGNALQSLLQLRMASVLYRQACLPDTERERTLDRILAKVLGIFAELGELSYRADADDARGAL